ncbi:MAG: cell division protein FtsZ [Chitinophagaceae bacterium]
MIHFDLPKEKSSIIKVIGVGGGGGNAVNHMFGQDIEGVNFIICNTDAQALSNSNIPNRIQLGPHLTQGLGAGANPEIGRQATEESLEEIKRILEVNTKMAFITAGMGGGTGTGGAPIIAKICKDLGILTVGIVTTPFAYEGKKRQIQAEEGIKTLKSYVDTLLVISNDKLRHQFGNLKMREAFEKADNVLATAAKCITDVINSTGQINVDFADVCTVMRSGGVAILGSATAAGENRAYKAIEEALNSPLLNDNDIRGAKWILININSSEGQNEFTMDEVEVIQNYLLSQAGENSDVILGLGYDNTLGEQLGITLIATGFQHKDPFIQREAKKTAEKKEDKIVMMLGQPEGLKREVPAPVKSEESKPDPMAPKLVEDFLAIDAPMPGMQDMIDLEQEREEEPVMHWELKMEEKEEPAAKAEEPAPEPGALFLVEKTGPADGVLPYQPGSLATQPEPAPQPVRREEPAKPVPATGAGGYLSRPSTIYAESRTEPVAVRPPVVTLPAEKPVVPPMPVSAEEEEAELPMQLVERPASPAPVYQQELPAMPEPLQDEEAEEQKRRTERLNKLRNLSFNVNAADPNNEFETVPAYIRRNMELYNSNHVEQFYSNYEVKADKNNQGQISTINTFLDGQKPD